ncbi:MAG TPA: tRNA pseudouridine(55) synthase TruB, partial [Candidatus Paceibacterota bacterium]|nr:tRNA pseudouridine(55) synthase TruB [Candidatus Paceibacterota bacterium]
MILNIDKPAGVTSHDVVNQVRKITGESRVGHAGTLDPFATGVLVVAVGREDTKKLGPINENSEKEYEALLELGKTSSTGDPDGTIQETLDPEKVSAITRVQIEHVLQTYT